MTYFCFGNGNSRKDLDLDKFKQYGKVVGCNAIYRDYTPDLLVALDSGMAHEIYRSGYAHKNTTYLGYWDRIPVAVAEFMLEKEKGPVSLSPSDLDFVNEVVYHGGEGVFTLDSKVKGITYCTGVVLEDEANSLEPLVVSGDGSQWAYSTGTLSIFLACSHGAKEVYIIGHDLYSLDDKVNNIYAGSRHYVDKDSPMMRPDNSRSNDLYNWIQQHKNTFACFPDTKFYKVNPNTIGTSPIDVEIEEWKDSPNLEYITFAELDKRFPI